MLDPMTPVGPVTLAFFSVLSGLLGVLVSVIVYGRRENRRFKIDTLKRFAANRYDLRSAEFSRALNEIFVVFNSSEPVMTALQTYHDTVVARQDPRMEDDLIRLYKAMCDEVGISYSNFNDSFFLTPFNARTDWG